MSYALDPRRSDCGIPDAIVAELDDALADLDELQDDPEGAVHSARKHLKKARSAARLTRGAVPGAARRDVSRRIRDAGRRLSDVRDATVKLETIARLAERDDAGATAKRGLERLAGALDDGAPEGSLGRASAAARTEIEVARAEALGLRPDRKGFALPAKGLQHEYARGREAMTSARGDPTDEVVHAWRKRSKDLWYHLRLVSPAWPEGLRSSVEAAHDLSDLLGDHHDLAVVAGDLREGDGLTPPQREAVEKLLRGAQDELLERALELGSRLYAEKPAAWRRRLGALWRVAEG